MTLGDDGIYGYCLDNKDQESEIKLRERTNIDLNDDYLKLLSKHHSIPVMDREVFLFLERIPQSGVIIDVGGCWGWHWRNIAKIRPDVRIYIVDFIRSNLVYASNILKDIINNNVFLIHGDATNLNFKDDIFDGYWSVQTLQHVPSFSSAIDEAYRVLRHDGVFVNYSLNNQKMIKFIYKLFNKKYHEDGMLKGRFYLDRASEKQLNYIQNRFNNNVKQRFSEILFSPELGISLFGRRDSIMGVFDSYLSNDVGAFSSIARQHSFHVSANKF
jgi:ubiquinone/menaquinone biosynthesis C-methylase UbiE